MQATKDPVRSKAAIDAAMASIDARAHESITDTELDGVLAAGVMLCIVESAGLTPLPEIEPWLAALGGITQAAKQLIAIVAESGPCTRESVWLRFGGGTLAEQEWDCFLEEAIESGLLLRTSDGRVVATRR